MQTQLTTITQHQVGLTFADEAEARDFLANPEKAQAAVREQLAAVHANGGGQHDDAGMPVRARRAPKQRTKKVGGAKTVARSAAKVITKGLTFHCGECDRSFTSAGFLARHERQVHSGVKGLEAEAEDE